MLQKTKLNNVIDGGHQFKLRPEQKVGANYRKMRVKNVTVEKAWDMPKRRSRLGERGKRKKARGWLAGKRAGIRISLPSTAWDVECVQGQIR